MKLSACLGLLLCVLALPSCNHEDETADGWCSLYGNCDDDDSSMCSFYGNCPDKKGSVWGSGGGAGSDADSSHVGGIDHTDGTH